MLCRLSFLILCFLAVNVVSQTPELIIEPIDGPVPWSNLDLNNDDDMFQFAIVTDRTGGHRPGVFMDAVNKLNLMQPEFVMSVGDLIEGYTEDLVELEKQWDEFNGFIDQLEMPFFYVPGNHDITNSVMEKLWLEKFGKSYYHFIYKNVLFLCLNSEDDCRGASRGTISDDQYDWIQQTLETHDEVKWTLVFFHQPLWDQDAETLRWNDVEKLLADRKHTIFCGHRHRYSKFRRNNSNYIILATTGGGSQLRGTTFGEFDQLAWITMTDEGPVMANLLLSGIWDENVNTEERMDYAGKLYKSQPILIEPLIIDNLPFDEGVVHIKLRNPTKNTMEVSMKEHFAWDLNGKFDKNKVEIAPKSSETVSLQLESREGVAYEDLRPLKATFTFNTVIDDQSAVSLPADIRFKPIIKQQLEKRKKKVKIDGKLREWKSLPFQFGSENGADLSVQYQVCYDDEYLYLAAKVLDDSIVVDNTTSIWQLDNLSWIVNAQPMQQCIMSTGRSYYYHEFQLRRIPETKNIESRIYAEKRLPEGAMSAARSTSNGYVVEYAIPLKAISKRHLKEWEHIRINVIVDDYDKLGGPSQRYAQYPDWWAEDNFIGSGLMFK